jgi:periplasmic divalent cation tolerance protein
MSDVRIVLITAPDLAVAATLGRALVEERLAACANLVPQITSIYRWEGAVQEDSEVLIVVKTSAGRVAALTERVLALHPYEVPEVLVLPVDSGAAAYLDWVRAAVE